MLYKGEHDLLRTRSKNVIDVQNPTVQSLCLANVAASDIVKVARKQRSEIARST